MNNDLENAFSFHSVILHCGKVLDFKTTVNYTRHTRQDCVSGPCMLWHTTVNMHHNKNIYANTHFSSIYLNIISGCKAGGWLMDLLFACFDIRQL
jgi:hypothetical protein